MIINYTNETENNINKGSSETLREALIFDDNFLSWFIGFAEGDGCFTAYSSKKTETYTQISVNYILSQKGEKELMYQLNNLLNGTIHYLKSYEGYNVRVTLSKLNPIINYFKRFPLRTKKHISFLTWVKIYNLVIEKKHLTPEGLETKQYNH